MEEIRKVARACFQRGSSEKKELEDIGKVARAYFERSSSEEKTSARVFFGELDDNGDGKISVQEFESVTSSSHVKDLFKNLDENGDGILDFNEVLAFYYMEKTGVPGCGSCKELLLGPYFSCATCLGKGSESYDLCCDCYSGGEYSHEHSLDNFMDTRAQLKLLRDLMKNAEITPGQKVEININISKESTSKGEKAFDRLHTVVNVGSVLVTVGSVAAATVCRIM